MKHLMLIAAVLVSGMAGLIGSASAQFYPGYGYGGWGGTDGSAALLGANQLQATAMQLKAQSTQFGQERTMQQNAIVQNGIRSTLSNQATAQTNAILSQQQANQDWWFQQQAQQTSQRRAMEAENGMQPIPVGFAPGGGPPPVNMDIIKWPSLLQEPCFASERTQIEAPYRRTPPKLSIPTVDDYRMMVGVVENMKAVLDWRMSEGVNTAEYNTAKAFLNRLGQEVASRAESAVGAN